MSTKPIFSKNIYINFAKAFSIITIVLYHYFKDLSLPGSISKIVSLGGGGVHLFIFASGFGLYLSQYIDFKTFLIKRFSKVLIPYYIAVSLIFLINYLLLIYPFGLSAYLSHIFLYKMFIENYEGSFGGQFWFISTIIQFYLIFPIILSLIKRFNSWTCLFLSIAISLTYSITISLMGYGELRTVNSFFLQYLWEFVFGMIIAKEGLIDKIINLKLYILIILPIISYIIMAILVLKFGRFGRNVNDLFSFIGYFGFSILFYRIMSSFKPIFKIIMSVEPISFSLFLTHYLVYAIYSRIVFHGLKPLHIPLVFLTAIIVAIGFNALIKMIPPLALKKSHFK